MNVEERQSSCFRFCVEREGKEVGRAYLYLIRNDLREAPYGLLEDVFVDESYRGQGIGTELTNAVIVKAKEIGCYKLLATSRMERPQVHALYEKLGFQKHGFEFRMDLI